jgi:hypothetical protein
MKREEHGELIERLRQLHITQDEESNELIARHRRQRDDIFNEVTVNAATRPSRTPKQRREGGRHLDRDGTELLEGDRVTILTSGRTGKIGDQATISKFGRVYATIRVRSGTNTSRACKNLRLVTARPVVKSPVLQRAQWRAP